MPLERRFSFIYLSGVSEATAKQKLFRVRVLELRRRS